MAVPGSCLLLIKPDEALNESAVRVTQLGIAWEVTGCFRLRFRGSEAGERQLKALQQLLHGLSDERWARALKHRFTITFNPLPSVFVLG